MYAKFKDLINKKDSEGLRELTETSDTAELCSIILPRLLQSDAPSILDQLLSNFSTSEASQPKRRKLAEAVLKALRTSKASTSHANALITRIIQDLPKYQKLQLLKLIDFCLDGIRSDDDEFTSWKDILPITLQILEEEKYVNYRGTEVSGAEYKSLIVKSICNQPWEIGTLTSLAKMFGEMRMDRSDHDLVIRAICDKIPDVNHKELPPLIHQVLRLSANVDSRLIIVTLQKYFARLYSSLTAESPETVEDINQLSLKEVQDTESTVLYHIRQSALLNHSSLKDFVKSLKSVTNAPEFILEAFPMSVLLLISDIYEEQIFDTIKAALVRKIHDEEKRRGSFWLKEVLPESWKVMDMMEQIIENSNKDRHLVIKGLVDLSFVILETGKSKDGEDNELHDIGVKILLKLIKKRHEIGKTVLRHLTDKIVAGGTAISHYIECLAYICRKMTFVMQESQVWVSTLLEQLLSIPGEAATQVLYATMPLIRVSQSIRDTLVLILRKALYRKGVETRKMAVTGFLQFLGNLKIAPFSLSQSSSNMNTTSSSIFTQATMERGSQVSKPNPRSNVAFCQEILSILTKCFSQEAEVRQHLYRGLREAVAQNTELAEPTIDLLLNHFSDFYEMEQEVRPPIHVEECSSVVGPEAVLLEPIGDLIFCLQDIYCTAASKNLSSLDQLSDVLESLCRRMTQSAIDNLNLDVGDLLDNLPKSQQKVNSLKVMATTLEALMTYRFGSWSRENESIAQNVYSLFKCYNEIVEFCKRVNKPGKPKKGEKGKKDREHDTTQRRGAKAQLKLPPTIISIDTIYKMLSLLHDPSVAWATKEQCTVLRRRPDFNSYCLQTCVKVFHGARTLRNLEREKHREAHAKDYLKLGELLYKQIVCDLDRIREFDEETAVLGLECFREYCDLMCTVFTSELSKFLGEVCSASPSEGLTAQVNQLISSLRTLIDAYYEEELQEEGPTTKIPLILFETIALLLGKTGTSDGSYAAVFDWLKGIAQSDKLDTQISLMVLQLIALIEDRDAEHGKILDELCVELCKKLGTIDDSNITLPETYKALTEASMPQAHSIFNNSLRSKLVNCGWVLGRLRAEQVMASSPGIGDEAFREKLKDKERTLCRQLSYIIQTLQTLANADIEPGPNTELTFKNLHQLYHVLNHLTKYFISKSTPQNPAFQAVKFIQVVQLAGKALKATFYNLITHTEEKQNSGRKTDAQALRNKVLKETKFIPKVVYEIEQFNKEILTLGKKTGVPLESFIKHSITRDFRIKHPQLVEGLERLDPSQMISMTQNTTRNETEAHTELSDEESSVISDNDGPPPKRRKHEVSA